ncbi:hypothetical protein DN398_04695 [Bacillus sp. JAS102]|nr:hypothetical protein DN398_04695 [Bacillus sp. JAS102]OOL10725.1 hypothetical protein BHL37_17830 [Bacillus cereus]PES88300.1 hypothetical protein CN504_04185 [Bacillus anthracis]PJZ22510.1 hypothetical protein CEW46_07160 [Bacillus cereus]TXR83867.1 hypothetical protein DN396_11775 [Bacillus sp. BF9-10]
MTFSFPPSETSHLHTNFSMQKETLLQHVFYDYNTFYHFRSTIWQNKRRIDALPFSKTMRIAVILSPEGNYIFIITPFLMQECTKQLLISYIFST